MKIKELIIGLLIGSILGIAGTFFAFQGRISKLEGKIESNSSQEIESIKPTTNELQKEEESRLPKLETLIIEKFSNNNNGWYLDETKDHKINIIDEKLIISCKSSGRTSTYSEIDLNPFFPKYSLEVECEYVSGEKGKPFGIILTDEQYKNYYQFNYDGLGYGNVLYVSKDSIRIKTDKLGFKSNKDVVKLSIEVKGSKFKYYVNGNLNQEGNLKFWDFKTIRPFVSSGQIVGFDNLMIEKL